MPDNWYPERANFPTHEQWDSHVQTLNVVYEQKAKLEQVIADLKVVSQKSNVGQAPSGGAINTSIGGFRLIPGQPANGDSIRYDAASGQFKFGP